MTRPLTPRIPKPWRPRPLSPLLTLAVIAMGVAMSAGAGLRAAARDSTPAAAVVHSVQMANFAFAPQALAVTSGDSVTWTNQDEAPHTVTTTSGPRSISSPMLSKGQSFTYTFVVPGTYSYYCAVHPDMRAQIIVNPAPAAASTPSSSMKSPSAKPSIPLSSAPAHSAAGGVVNAATPTMNHSTAASSASPAVTSAPPATSVPTATSAAPAASDPSPPPADDAAAAPATAGGRPLEPALVLAGLTAGTTVFCLLLVASRRNDEP